ncbi:hypothetical protein [Rhodococcus artemisiae]|uniref:DUF8175 domain-containing protein n=1 Tax=Rhodococcus artemisiae TaxID=714159 RepID=A0ABU7LJV6_9NOCA|nr:hypothetical protein [Rhodococcus artemisiae]MEE2061819.1 hypothetical protein [Rhodococcus artemisiae]
MSTFRRRVAASIVAVGAAVVLITGCGSSSDAPDSATVSSIDTTAAPADLRWDSYRGVQIPRSLTSGPNLFDIVAHGYEKSPQGAVLAAIRGQAYLALEPDHRWGKVVAVVTAPGAGRDEFAASRALVSITGDVPADTASEFVAFKVPAYDADAGTAVVEVVQQLGQDLFAYPVALQWIGDWRLVLPTAAENVDAHQLETLDGYTRLEATA